MKRNAPLPEKEAKSIVFQILTGIRYLNTKKDHEGQSFIHYDLKPGNIFFHLGEVKIGDFGLSKIVDEPCGGDTIELTSRGVGTYWYLPPECMLGNASKISNKVDVWSAGVIFYELMFNRRPFGHGMTQDEIWHSSAREGTFELVIPPQKNVSAEAKEFLQRLLSDNRDRRPDVFEALADTYLRRK